ncbi:odorant receptor 131-2-like [Sparus aurata]|uniref:odorant receptor 131-2-like n=1 Tax=Sparus aurata TaxID=8175 RepID=UPI0011C0EF3C|nr:odorant receptor 131-2-like [Sparus aurata]
MSLSNTDRNVTAVVYRDSLNIAIVKNVTTVVLCISINYVNGVLVHTFKKHRVLNINPRYILYIHLVINDIILLTLSTLIQVLSYIVFTLNVSLCIFLLMISIPATLNNPVTLAVMAVECYIAICLPLHHTQICTVKKAYVVIGLTWVIGMLSILTDLFFTLATESMEFLHSRVFCLWKNVFRHPSPAEKSNISNILLMVIVWITLFDTYFRIIFTAKAATADAKKARNTVLLHGFQLILCMLTYIHDLAIEGLTYLFPRGCHV